MSDERLGGLVRRMGHMSLTHGKLGWNVQEFMRTERFPDGEWYVLAFGDTPEEALQKAYDAEAEAGRRGTEGA